MGAVEARGRAVAERITGLMERAGVQQADLVDRVGIPRETLSRKLNRQPWSLTIKELSDIADALDVSFEAVVFGAEAAVA